MDLKKIKFYLWIGGAYLVLWMFVDLVSHPDNFLLWWANEIWRAIYIVVVIYFFYEFTLKKINRKRILYSIFLLGIQVFLFSFGLYGWRALGIELNIYTPFTTYISCGNGVGDQFGASLFAIVFFGLIKHIYNYNKLKQAAQQLRIEKQEAELNYLKSQTNPHFLFNTLNNIYSLSRDKSDQTPESILKLSKILRFMLYESGSAFISIEKELKIINDYIALEKLRYDESLQVNFNHDVEEMNQSIPPLLLIPLVENAFKHGASETRSFPFVDIHLTIKSRSLTFVVKNSTEKTNKDAEIKENIGLSNLRRQLELLYRDFELNVQQDETTFTAILKINLASHV